MLNISYWFVAMALLGMSSGCQRASAPNITQGVYKLSSATLNHGGKFRELTCKGEFEFTLLKADAGFITLEPSGQSECASANPASFIERLGGECDLGFVNFFSNGMGESYIHNGGSLTCFASSNSEVKFVMQPINSKTIRITRMSSSETDIQSEILFERSRDAL